MKQILIYVLSVLALSTSAQIETHPPRKVSPRVATVHTLDGKKLKGIFFKMDDNNIYLLSTSTKKAQFKDYDPAAINTPALNINVSQINRISTQRKNAGLKGALIGLGVGAATGAIMGFADGDDPMEPYTGFPLADIVIALSNSFRMTAEEKATVGALTGALTGAIAGFVIGKLAKKKFMIGGRKENYRDLQGELMKRLIVK